MRGDTGRAFAQLARLSLASVTPLSARVTPAFPAAFARARGLASACFAPTASTRASTARSAAAFATARGLAASTTETASSGASGGGSSSPFGKHSGSPDAPDRSVPSPLRRSPAPKNTTRPTFSGTLTDAGARTTVKAHRRETKGSPKKFNDVCRLVRGLTVEDAVAQCALSPKRYADVVRKVILSAAANATNNHDLDREKLVITEALVGKGTFIKRISVHGRGRSGRIEKPRSHVSIAVAERGADLRPKRRMKVREHEAPWKRRRRNALRAWQMAERGGFVA